MDELTYSDGLLLCAPEQSLFFKDITAAVERPKEAQLRLECLAQRHFQMCAEGAEMRQKELRDLSPACASGLFDKLKKK